MSLLEMVGSILTELEKVQEKLDRLLAKPFKLVDHKKEEKLPETKKENPILGDGIPVDARYPATEPEAKEGAQDLTQVLLFNETPKAFLVVKHGFQVWVAKSHLENAKGYDLGNTYDLKVKETSKWVLKKLAWKPFEVFKD